MASKVKAGGETTVKLVVDGGKKEKRTAAEKAEAKEKADLFDRVAQLRKEVRPGEVGYRVGLFRWSDAAKDDEYLGPIPVEEFSLDRVRELFGGGKYRARIMNDGGQYLSQNGERLGFRIGGPPRHPDERAAVVVPAPDSTALLLPLLQSALTNRGGGSDMAPVLAAMIQAQAQQSNNMMTLIAQIAKGSSSGGDGLDNFDRILELAERLKGDGGGGDPLMMAGFGGIARALERVAESQKGRVEPLAPRALKSPAPANAPAAPAAPAATTPAEVKAANVEGSSVTLSDLKPYIVELVKLAKDDADQGLYAEVTLDRLAKHGQGILAYLIECREPAARARLESQLGAAFPETAAYREWFEGFFAEMWEQIDDELNATVDETAAASPTSDGGATPGKDGGKVH